SRCRSCGTKSRCRRATRRRSARRWGLAKGPELLDQAVGELAAPLAHQEGLDGLATLQELGAVPPGAVERVGERDARRVARVPGVLGAPDLLDGGFEAEGRDGRSSLGHVLSLLERRA